MFRMNQEAAYIYVSYHEIYTHMDDDLALRYVVIYPGVNSRAELITLVPGQ